MKSENRNTAFIRKYRYLFFFIMALGYFSGNAEAQPKVNWKNIYFGDPEIKGFPVVDEAPRKNQLIIKVYLPPYYRTAYITGKISAIIRFPNIETETFIPFWRINQDTLSLFYEGNYRLDKEVTVVNITFKIEDPSPYEETHDITLIYRKPQIEFAFYKTNKGDFSLTSADSQSITISDPNSFSFQSKVWVYPITEPQGNNDSICNYEWNLNNLGWNSQYITCADIVRQTPFLYISPGALSLGTNTLEIRAVGWNLSGRQDEYSKVKTLQIKLAPSNDWDISWPDTDFGDPNVTMNANAKSLSPGYYWEQNRINPIKCSINVAGGQWIPMKVVWPDQDSELQLSIDYELAANPNTLLILGQNDVCIKIETVLGVTTKCEKITYHGPKVTFVSYSASSSPITLSNPQNNSITINNAQNFKVNLNLEVFPSYTRLLNDEIIGIRYRLLPDNTNWTKRYFDPIFSLTPYTLDLLGEDICSSKLEIQSIGKNSAGNDNEFSETITLDIKCERLPPDPKFTCDPTPAFGDPIANIVVTVDGLASSVPTYFPDFTDKRIKTWRSVNGGEWDLMTPSWLNVESDFQMTAPCTFTEADNNVRIHFRVEKWNGINDYDTDKTCTILYSIPLVDNLTYSTIGAPLPIPSNNIIVLKNNPTFSLNFTLRAYYHYLNIGKDEITGYRYRVGDPANISGVPWKFFLLNNPSDAPTNITGLNLTSLLNCGWNEIELQAIGDAGGEFSKSIHLKVFLLGLDLNLSLLPATLTPSMGNYYNLIACPEGGQFSGPGMKGSTPWFTPFQLTAGDKIIKYSYWIDNIEYSVTGTIKIVTGDGGAAEFKIVGDSTVCPNSNLYIYTIKPPLGAGDIITWFDPEGGEIDYSHYLKSENMPTIQVRWDKTATLPGSPHLRKSTIKAEVNIKGVMVPVTKIIDIGQFDAPDKPELYFPSKNLLICTNKDAQEYFWYDCLNSAISLPDPALTSFVGIKSNKPYQLYTNRTDNTTYFVKIKGVDGCQTIAYIKIPGEPKSAENSNLDQSLGDGKMVLFPNPAQSELNIGLTSELESGTVEVSDPFGRLSIKEYFVNIDKQLLRLNISFLAPGCYFVKFTGADKIVLMQKFIKL